MLSILVKILQLGVYYYTWLFNNTEKDVPSEPKRESLFPSITNVQIEDEYDEESSDYEYDSDEPRKHSIAQPCSTGLTTRLLPFRNEDGEIEWAFTDDMDVNQKLLPTVSNSSNNDSIISGVKKEEEEDDVETSPFTNHSLPFYPSEKVLMVTGKDGSKMHQCPHCDATFKIRGYLTRHLKKHAEKKAYLCPFHEFSVYIDENNVKHKCHPSGGFSRRDTYKTHLKLRHFKYPKGTKTKERNHISGHCLMCGDEFPNAEIWCELHVEGGECKFLPSGFKGKSRIKNRLKKLLTKQQQKELEESGVLFLKQFTMAAAVAAAQNSNAQLKHNLVPRSTPSSMSSLLFSEPQKHVCDNQQHYQEAHSVPQFGAEYNTPFLNTPSLSASNTTPTNGAQYEYNDGYLQSPVGSITSMQANGAQQFSLSVERSESIEIPRGVDQVSTGNSFQSAPMYESPMFNQRALSFLKEDYDDDFCLDIDQLNNATFNNFNEMINYMKLESQPFFQSPFQPQTEYQGYQEFLYQQAT